MMKGLLWENENDKLHIYLHILPTRVYGITLLYYLPLQYPAPSSLNRIVAIFAGEH